MIAAPRSPASEPPSSRAGTPVPCGMDRHFGPFELLEGTEGWLGTDWFLCRGCRAVVTRANAARPAAA